MTRIESSVTSVSWIPMQAAEGLFHVPFDLGVAHYDPPPSETLDLPGLLAQNAFRFANELRAWIDVDAGGRILSHGAEGRGYLGATKVGLGPLGVSFAAVPFPELRPAPEVGLTSVRFVQTCGGRTGAPMPCRVPHPPFVRLNAPPAWTTLALTLHADGRATPELLGASPFPRHWVYDSQGHVTHKSGLIDFQTWFEKPEGQTPWGGHDSPAIMKACESVLERHLSGALLAAGPRHRRVAAGEALVTQGEAGDDVFLLFDGILAVEAGGQPVAELGPGAIVGEMAHRHGGRRTATLRAVTPCRVAEVPYQHLDPDALAQIAASRG